MIILEQHFVKNYLFIRRNFKLLSNNLQIKNKSSTFTTRLRHLWYIQKVI